MTTATKWSLWIVLTVALGFGFLEPLNEVFALDFDRLHVFLFNLCTGGAILLFHAENIERPSKKVAAFWIVSTVYAATAFFELYYLTIAISLPLFAITESVRWKRFGVFPWAFFKPGAVGEKFLQAALLCLSIGIVIASLVMLNNEYLRLFVMEKLTLDVFFLGYSFPLSLLTMSLVFEYIDKKESRIYRGVQDVLFWVINLGVITFFIFIIFEMTLLEVLISNTLLISVTVMAVMFARNSKTMRAGEAWTFRPVLLSGLLFLILTGLTGVFYLFEYLFPVIEAYHDYLLTWHATVALYGWNLSGLLVVVRQRAKDSDAQGIPGATIGLHWLTVLFLAPAGMHFPIVAPLALPAYMAFLYLGLFGVKRRR